MFDRLSVENVMLSTNILPYLSFIRNLLFSNHGKYNGVTDRNLAVSSGFVLGELVIAFRNQGAVE